MQAGIMSELSVNAPNHIAVPADMTSATWNAVGTHEVFQVTGMVRVRTWVECTAIHSSHDTATLQVGFESETTAMLGTTVATYFAPGFWIDRDLTGVYAASSTCMIDRMSWGGDIGYEIGVEAILSGTLIFHCVWEPLSAGATVVAGAGGPL